MKRDITRKTCDTCTDNPNNGGKCSTLCKDMLVTLEGVTTSHKSVNLDRARRMEDDSPDPKKHTWNTTKSAHVPSAETVQIRRDNANEVVTKALHIISAYVEHLAKNRTAAIVSRVERILVLHFIEGLSYTAVARKLGETEREFAGQIARSRNRRAGVAYVQKGTDKVYKWVQWFSAFARKNYGFDLSPKGSERAAASAPASAPAPTVNPESTPICWAPAGRMEARC